MRLKIAMEEADVSTSTASGENTGQVTFAICGFGSRVCGGKSVNLNDFSREALE